MPPKKRAPGKTIWQTFSTVAFLGLCVFMLILYNEISMLHEKLQAEKRLHMKEVESVYDSGLHQESKGKGGKGRLVRSPKGKAGHLGKNGTSHLPAAIIIGAPHSGTDALRLYMNNHPDLAGPKKDVNFFNEYFSKGVKFYESKMPSNTKGQVLFESSPKYFVDPNVPLRVRNSMPEDVKLILIIRDPLKRIMSDYLDRKKKFKDGQENSKSLDELCIIDHMINTKYEPIKFSLYENHLARWTKYFTNRKNLLILDGEIFEAKPWEILRQVEEHLGVSSMFKESLFTKNENTGFWCMEGLGEECKKDIFPNKLVEINEVTRKALSKYYYRDRMEKFVKLAGMTFQWYKKHKV